MWFSRCLIFLGSRWLVYTNQISRDVTEHVFNLHQSPICSPTWICIYDYICIYNAYAYIYMGVYVDICRSTHETQQNTTTSMLHMAYRSKVGKPRSRCLMWYTSLCGTVYIFTHPHSWYPWPPVRLLCPSGKLSGIGKLRPAELIEAKNGGKRTSSNSPTSCSCWASCLLIYLCCN